MRCRPGLEDGRFDLRAWNGGVYWGVGLTMPVSSRSEW